MFWQKHRMFNANVSLRNYTENKNLLEIKKCNTNWSSMWKKDKQETHETDVTPYDLKS